MRGISEKDLKDRQDVARRIKDYVRSTLIDELISECKELNPWRPIDENATTTRKVLLFDASSKQQSVGWVTANPQATHYQELPAAPL